MALPIEVYMCFKDFKTTKSLWTHLEDMFKGKEKLKKIKKNKLKHQFETFHHIDAVEYCLTIIQKEVVRPRTVDRPKFNDRSKKGFEAVTRSQNRVQPSR
jgi:hypothetical protein